MLRKQLELEKYYLEKRKDPFEPPTEEEIGYDEELSYAELESIREFDTFYGNNIKDQ